MRLRLTALYVGLFLASGACLLVITYFLVAQQLPGTLTVQSRTSGGNAAGGTEPGDRHRGDGRDQRHHRLRAAGRRHVPLARRR